MQITLVYKNLHKISLIYISNTFERDNIVYKSLIIKYLIVAFLLK